MKKQSQIDARRTGWMIAALAAALSLQVVAVSGARPGTPDGAVDWTKEQRFWSFQQPKAQARPTVKNKVWPRQPFDYFILNRLERKGLTPSPEADKRTLIRRVTFDLTGLPPTPEEVEDFLKDLRPGAYDRLVERLLASPRFGERMASMWLPLARYAEDQAHQVGDDTKYFYPNAYKYRDWVIGAFNRDLPYDQFIRLQLAADIYRSAPVTSTGPESRSTEDGQSAQESDNPSSIVHKPARTGPSSPLGATAANDLAALGFLGLGPKYYNRGRLEVIADEWEDRVDTVTRSFLGLTVACARCHDHKFDPIKQADYYALAGVFASTKMVNRTTDGKPEKTDAKAQTMSPGTLHVVEDGPATNLNIFIRGNVEQKGPVVERRFLRVLCKGDPAPFKVGSGRRDLAEAIASRDNPLTARVMVNRVWGLFLGRPLVSTPSNFGRLGSPPTHPELLDDLSVRFMNNAWSLKSLAREIVLSSTYRQVSGSDAKKAKSDAPNDLLWRMNRRRLTVEQWRDTALFVSGELKWEGPNSPDLDDQGDMRRTVYSRISRLKLNDMLAQFDYPDANVHAEKRSVTTTPIQKLFMLNSPFMLSRAAALSARLAKNALQGDAARAQQAYMLLFGRNADAAELKLALGFLHGPPGAGMSRWEQYAQILLASNEMLYVD